jgi:hypothetical protein
MVDAANADEMRPRRDLRVLSVDGRRIDGRTLRRTNRTVTLATKVTKEFDDRVREIAQREGIMLVEVLERALDALDRQQLEQAAK